jgi:hypothetical protein
MKRPSYSTSQAGVAFIAVMEQPWFATAKTTGNLGGYAFDIAGILFLHVQT